MSQQPLPEPQDEQPEPVEEPDSVNDPDDLHGSDVTDSAGAPEPTD